MAKRINSGMFTKANADLFWSNVDKPDKNDCRKWMGATTEYRSRRFGLFRVSGSGYVMNQRFVYITQNALPEREYGIKVRPATGCKLGELCCNPLHIMELKSRK